MIIAKGFYQCKGSLIIHRVILKFNWAAPPLILRMAKEGGQKMANGSTGSSLTGSPSF